MMKKNISCSTTFFISHVLHLFQISITLSRRLKHKHNMSFFFNYNKMLNVDTITKFSISLISGLALKFGSLP